MSVENVVIATKDLQDRNNLLLDGKTVENKGKLILTEIFPSVQNMIFKSINTLKPKEIRLKHILIIFLISNKVILITIIEHLP